MNVSDIVLRQMMMNNVFNATSDSGSATQGDVTALVVVLVLSVTLFVAMCIWYFRD